MFSQLAGFFDFGGEFFDAGDDAALFGEWGERYVYFKKPFGLKANPDWVGLGQAGAPITAEVVELLASCSETG